MSFFEDLPEPESAEPERYVEPEWRRIPHEVVPVELPSTQLVFASESWALVFHGVAVYPRGFTFGVVATLHPEAARPAQPTHELLHGHHRTNEALRVGVLHADGTRAVHPDFGRPPRQAPAAGQRPGPPAAAIGSRGGSASNETASTDFFVWPIPASGDLTLVFRWTGVGLDEARVVIPGDDLRAAAVKAESQEIWPGATVPPPSEGAAWC